MALVVQTDSSTVVESADSYISLADADIYFANHGSPSIWAALSDADKESALRYATSWVDSNYSWVGCVSSAIVDRLLWPRTSAYSLLNPSAQWVGVPRQIRDAVCEVALAHASNPLNETESRGGQVRAVKAGSAYVEFESGAPAGETYPWVDSIIYGSGAALSPGRIIWGS